MKRIFMMLAGIVLFIGALPGVGLAAEVDGAPAELAATTITLLHTNDTHGRVEEAESDGMGFAKISAIAKQMKADNPNTLLLDAGDTFHGTTFATLQRGESIARIMNAVGYDAMAAGNHDFNYGYERLIELKEMLVFPVLSANVRDEDGERLLEPYIIREVDGIKLGIFGLTTPETTYKTHPNNVKGLTFADPAEEARAVIAELEGEVDAIIAVTHLGIDESSTETSIKVAKEAPGIDVIVDGHSHSTLVEGLDGENNTLIVSAGEYTKHLGVVEIEFDKQHRIISKKARLISKEDAADVEADEEILSEIEKVKQAQETVLSEIVGETAVQLDGEREQVRAGETNLGNLITDAILDVTGADVALTNGGGIRASIDIGEITIGEIITVLPFGNYIVTKEVSGADLKAALENGASAYPETKGAFAHVGGMAYAIDPDQPAGERVHSVTIGGEPLDLEATYVLATNDFIAAGGDEYTMFQDDPITGEYPALDEALIAYIQKLGEVTAAVEGRIQVVAVAADDAAKPEEAGQPEEAVENKEPSEDLGTSQEDSDEAADDPGVLEEVVNSPAEDETNVYIVQKGDNLYRIGQRFGTTWQKLAEINKLKNPALIYPGQRIILE